MARGLISVCLMALLVAVLVAPAGAQKLDIQARGNDVGGIPEGGIDYSVAVDDTGAAYEFIDTTGGTDVAIGDDEYVAFTWPFDFSVYNNNYVGGVDQFEINSNGSVHFDIGGPRTLWPNCGDIPSTIDGQFVAPLGDDLDPSSAGTVSWDVTAGPDGDILSVSWLGVPEFGGTGSVDIQVNFFENTNKIVTQYVEVIAPDFLGDGVVGINSGDGVVGTEVACAASGTMPRPVHDVEYTPMCNLTAVLNSGSVIRADDAIWVEVTVEHAKPGSVTANATVVLNDLSDGHRVARARFRDLQFEQFQRTSFGKALSNGLPAGNYELEITLDGMSGWERRARQLVVVE